MLVRLVAEKDVFQMLVNDEVKQSLMAAPLWKYFCLKNKASNIVD